MEKPSLTPSKRPIALLAIVFLLAIIVGILVWQFSRPKARVQATPAAPTGLSYSVESLDPALQTTLSAVLTTIQPDLKRSSSSADIEIVSDPRTTDTQLKIQGAPEPQPIPSGEILAPKEITIGLRSQRLTQAESTQLAETLTQKLRPTSSWTYLALGDIIPARDVYTYARRSGYGYPYLKIQDRTKAADLAVTNLETTIADGQAFLQGEGVLTFTAPKASLEGLLASGIDGVSLANNHAMNGGGAKVTEMLTHLSAARIGSFGVATKGSPNTWTTTVKDTTITHLSYDTVPGNLEPTTTSPGAQRIPLKPWGSLSSTDTQRVQTEVKAAKQASDVVIPWFHWGTEYTHIANDEQLALAHAAIDAGAEAVIGTHPHWTQGFEWYKGHLIAYSLGNFVFDQNWSEETKRSVALELTFTDKHVSRARLLPARIENWVQPQFLEATSPVYKQILQDIAKHSWWQ